MRQKPLADRNLLHNGEVVCTAHTVDAGDIDRVLREGDTYAADDCDRCGPRIAPIVFRAKIEHIYAVENRDTPLYSHVKVPVIKRSHCDMHLFRCKSQRYGALANSDLFSAALKRGLADMGIGAYLRLDRLPAGVEVDDSGFLAKVSIFLPLN